MRLKSTKRRGHVCTHEQANWDILDGRDGRGGAEAGRVKFRVSVAEHRREFSDRQPFRSLLIDHIGIAKHDHFYFSLHHLM